MNLKDKCSLWLLAAQNEHLSDHTFDELSNILALRYNKLPKWFKDKVPLTNLKCGTTLGLDFHKGI